MTGAWLLKRLEAEYGVKMAPTGNRHPIDPVAIREALAKRAIADLYDED